MSRKERLDKEEWQPVPGYEWLLRDVEPWNGQVTSTEED